jgi:hypothetical protein
MALMLAITRQSEVQKSIGRRVASVRRMEPSEEGLTAAAQLLKDRRTGGIGWLDDLLGGFQEKASKTKIKILCPHVIFIFPCIFSVLSAPAIIGIIRSMQVFQ